MTSRPAAPESEMPDTLVEFDETALWTAAQWCKIARRYHTEWREAERRLSLAQTEIKGHMRTEDDLRRDLADEVAIVDRVWKALGIETYEDAKPFAIDEHVARLKVRIAELEKELTWCADHSGECLGDHMQRLNLIRALLKSRA